MNLDKNPYEAGLDPFIKPNKKTAFVGQDAVREMQGQEQKVKLVMLNFQTQNVDPYGNETIWYGNKVSNQHPVLKQIIIKCKIAVACGIGLQLLGIRDTNRDQNPNIFSGPYFNYPNSGGG